MRNPVPLSREVKVLDEDGERRRIRIPFSPTV